MQPSYQKYFRFILRMMAVNKNLMERFYNDTKENYIVI